MEDLVTYLHMLNGTDLSDNRDYMLSSDDHELVPVIRTLASQFLLGADKNPLFEEIDTLHTKYGYFVVPRESGQAYIQTKKGFIVFG